MPAIGPRPQEQVLREQFASLEEHAVEHHDLDCEDCQRWRRVVTELMMPFHTVWHRHFPLQ
jgi:hypothetical protein